MNIDFVILWVDGSDPAWKEEKREYCSVMKSKGELCAKEEYPMGGAEYDMGEERYRDWGTLRFWFRSVERFAPWVHRIHFVTGGEVPRWLDPNHPKLHIVRHEDFIPGEKLPLFNSTAIEAYLHRIEGLSEHFVYFNDDMFLLRKTTERDFFRNTLPVDMLAFQPVVANPQNPVMSAICMNVSLVLAGQFRKRPEVLRHPLRYFRPGYPVKNVVYNLLELAFPKFTGFYTVHGPSAFLKTTFEEVWSRERETLERACSNRFRSRGDLGQYLFREWQKLSGHFTPGNVQGKLAYFELSDDNKELLRTIVRQKKKMICINDVGAVRNLDFVQRELVQAFERILPGLCSFEKEAWEEGFPRGENMGFLSPAEATLLELLKDALAGERRVRSLSCDPDRLIELAKNHEVLSLIADGLAETDLSDPRKDYCLQVAKKVVRQNYRLLLMGRYLTQLLEGAGCPVVLLKGAAAGVYYPIMELRKTGDIDLLLLQRQDLERASQVLQNNGFTRREEQSALHHIVFQSGEGFEVELHLDAVEPFDNERTNAFLRTYPEICERTLCRKEILGVELPVPGEACHGFELLLHMLQHLLRSGFGLKLLCDWSAFWRNPVSDRERRQYTELVRQVGLQDFSDRITEICILYLGLPAEQVSFMELHPDPAKCRGLFREILDAEEFGKSAQERMVALRGDSAKDLLREFHHQMALNYPKAGRFFLLWPILWGCTLYRFLHHNKSIRGVSTVKILRNAKNRGRIIKDLNLFS